MRIDENKKEMRAATRYIPVSKWSDYHPWPSIGGLRNLIFYRKENGFHKVIKKVGKNVLIDEAAFFEWVEDRNNESEK